MTHQMPPGAQIAFAKDWLERQNIDPQTIDVTAHIDPSLSYEENIKSLKQQFGLGGGRSQRRAARGMSAAECDVAIGNYEAGYNHEVTRDACRCGHPDACVDLERAERGAKTAARTTRKPKTKLNTVKDVEQWIAKKVLEYGGQNKFRSSPEYAETYPKIKKIYDQAKKQRIADSKRANIVENPDGTGYVLKLFIKNAYAGGAGPMGMGADIATFETVEAAAREAKRRGITVVSQPRKQPAKPKTAYEKAMKLHRSSRGLLPKNALDRLLKAKFILEHEGGGTDHELYSENERLIANYKRKLGIETTTPSMPPILTTPPELAADVLAAEDAALHASERRGVLRREAECQAEAKRKVDKKKPDERSMELRAEANKIRSTIWKEIKELKPLGQRSNVGAAMGIMPKRGVIVKTAVGEVVFAKTRQPSAQQLKRWELMYKKAEKISGKVAKRQVEVIKEAKRKQAAKPATKKPKPPKKTATAKPKAKPAATKKTAATPKLTAAQREYLAIYGFVKVKRGGKYVTIKE